VKLFHRIDDFPESFRGGAVAIGNFDGVHLGHARLIAQLRAMAERIGGPALVFTFDPPPVRILRPEAAPEPLLWIERKAEILAEMGVDALLVYPTDQALLGIDAREFFDRIVRDCLGARAMVEGPNFFFGRGRSGNVETLRRFCVEADMPFEVVEPVRVGDHIVSSSGVRSLVQAGRIDEADAILGRPYRIRGVVVRGAGRGAGLGYPTANVEQCNTLRPGDGIYAARAHALGRWRPAAVSVGANPTFNEGGRKIEAHLIAFNGMLYGEAIEIDFLRRLREIRRFADVDALVAQMARDVTATLEIAT
jgi:riboflavin kinase / FMN adenylyltransferase